mgnify:CR=1 FL=1
MWMVSTTLKIKSETRVKNGWKGPVFILKNQLILLLLLAPNVLYAFRHTLLADANCVLIDHLGCPVAG